MSDPITTCKFCKESVDDSRQLPTLLHVNQEARTHLLKIYITIKHHPYQNPIYFHKLRDTLILRREDSTFHYFPLRTYSAELFPQVQNIVVAGSYPPHTLGVEALCRYFSSFPLLDIRNLTFVFKRAEDPPHCRIERAPGGSLEEIFGEHEGARPVIGYMALENWLEETGWREKCCCLWWCQEPSLELLDSLSGWGAFKIQGRGLRTCLRGR